MAKQHKNRTNLAKVFFDYSEGKLSDRERHAHERRLQKDPFDADAAEGFDMISRDEAEKDLVYLEGKIQRRLLRKRRITWYSAAAAVASILIVTTIFFNINDNKQDRFETMPEMKEAAREQAQDQEEERQGNETAKNESTEMPVEKNDKDQPAKISSHDVGVEKKKAMSEPFAEKDKIVAADDISYAMEFETEEDEDAGIEVFELAASPEEEVAGERKLVSPRADQLQVRTEAQAESARLEAASKKEAAPSITANEVLSGKAAGVTISASPSRRVYGKVRSAEDLQPLPGVSLMVKGTTTGTVTDAEGNFEMELDNIQGNTVVASYIGMESEEFDAETDQPVELALLPDKVSLDEVVVIAYGSENRKESVGAVSPVEVNYKPEENYQSVSPLGGYSAFKIYLDSMIQHSILEPVNEKAVVILKFTVQKDGSLNEFRIIRSPAQEFSDEAIRIIRSGPSWLPASRNGEQVEETVRIRVVFEPDGAVQ